MATSGFQFALNWDESDLMQLPPHETDEYEYKSSRTKDDELGNKISKAASAFWNTGGGILIVGVDNDGKVDGGVTAQIGRQSRRDWVSEQVARTQPHGAYQMHEIRAKSSSSLIDPDKLVLILVFEDSLLLPHMAFDNKYYVRLDAHSISANHYLVEALRARRGIQAPVMRAMVRHSRQKERIVEFVLVVLNDASALDVEISFDPLPKMLQLQSDAFPIRVPAIDRSHPFSMDLYFWGLRSEQFGDEPVNVIVDYHDVLQRKEKYVQELHHGAGIAPIELNNTDLGYISTSLKTISKEVSDLNRTLKRHFKSDLVPPTG